VNIKINGSIINGLPSLRVARATFFDDFEMVWYISQNFSKDVYSTFPLKNYV